ncbi:MAG TPA: glycerate kinase [Usitatibacteraceae bacterium]|nr:glycerate kinase [Usitatibacteraceae bacterium]
MNARELLIGSFRAALTAADPLSIIPAHLPRPPAGRTLVVGAGKAAAAMAKAVDALWPAERPLEGTVITRYAHGYSAGDAPQRIRVVEAGHPVPDEAGEQAARTIFAQARSLTSDDLLLALVSGGGSSLLALPVGDIPMPDLKSVTRDLLASGAPIQDMNVVRKHLSLIQGGLLAKSTPAAVCALIISDVAGDDPSSIASGPTCADPSTYQDAIDILNQWRVTPPLSVARHLSRGARGEIAETPKPGDALFGRVENRLIATAHASLSMAAAYFQQHGITPWILGDTVTGEARDVAQVHAAIVRQIRRHHHPLKPPVALISGGECTVTLPQSGGRGGRCSEFLLALALALGEAGAPAIACDTDGIDGSENNAGAYLSPDALAKAARAGVDARQHLQSHDAWGFFAALKELVVTGPTRTNVNDYRAILIP